MILPPYPSNSSMKNVTVFLPPKMSVVLWQPELFEKVCPGALAHSSPRLNDDGHAHILRAACILPVVKFV